MNKIESNERLIEGKLNHSTWALEMMMTEKLKPKQLMWETLSQYYSKLLNQKYSFHFFILF